MTVGKYRGLQRLSDARGCICMCALDHRGSLSKMLEEGIGHTPSYQEMVDFKFDVCTALSPHCSAILLDPVYGAAQSIASKALAGKTGLLVSLEETGYSGGGEARVSRALEGWNAAKIRRMGADGAKLLLYYRPDVEVAARQRELVQELAKWCEEQDLAFIVEPVGYAIGDEAVHRTLQSNEARDRHKDRCGTHSSWHRRAEGRVSGGCQIRDGREGNAG